jgi:hypothetical protein
VYKIKTLLTASEIHEMLQEMEEMSSYVFIEGLLGGQ